MDGYKRFLNDLYRQIIADAGNDHSKIVAFNEKEIAKLLSLNYLQNVRGELGLSVASKRFEYIHIKHTRMATVLFELTKSDSHSSADQMKSDLTELQSCITKLWNTIQFLIHYRNPGQPFIFRFLCKHVSIKKQISTNSRQ